MYEVTCLKCKDNKMNTVYVGESANTGQCRGENHLSDLRRKRSGKPLWDHSEEEHGGGLQSGDFRMKVVKKYNTPLQRQIGEAMLIEKRGWTSDLLLNKKGEWNGTRVPRLRLESVEDKDEDLEEELLSRKESRKKLRQQWIRKDPEKRKCDETSDCDDNDQRKRMKRRRVDKEYRQQSCLEDTVGEVEAEKTKQTSGRRLRSSRKESGK